MSKLDELIQELCPNGVEYKQLKDLGVFYGGLTGKSKDDFENGNKIFITYKNVYSNPSLDLHPAERVKIGETENQRTLKYGDVIFTGSSETPDECGISSVVTEIPQDDLYLNSFCFIFRFDDLNGIYPPFMKHLFRSSSIRKQIGRTANGVTRYNVSKKLMAKISIPIPPMEIQKEIVCLLDDFTAKTEELQAELNKEYEARKKQYEYYRNAILNGDKNAETVKLGDVCDFVRGPFGGALKKDSFVSSGYAVYEQQHAIYQNTNIRYFIDSKKYNDLIRFKVSPNDIIVSCSGTIGKTYIIPNDAPKGIINQALLKLTAHDCLNVRYLQYIFENNLVKIMNNNARGGAIKNVPSVKELKNIEIQLPSNDTQGGIINILDNLESTCDNLQTNISVEFESRQKQYEYYRDKLLTFKELNESEVN